MKRVWILMFIAGMLLSVTGCQSPLHFDGLYQTKMDQGYGYLRFYADGTVLAASSVKAPKEVARWFDKDNIFAKGYYKVEGDRVKFTITDKYTSQDYSGVVTQKKIELTISSPSDDEPEALVYRFIPLDLAPDYSENIPNLNELLAPEKERTLVYQVKRDIDGDGKLEQIILDDNKVEHKANPDEYRRIMIYNGSGSLVFDSQWAGLDIRGSRFGNTQEFIKIEDNNKNGLPELYLQEKPSGDLPGRVMILESDKTDYHVLFFQKIENYYFTDLDHDGRQDLVGETGGSAWELLYYKDKTVFKQQGDKFLPSYELTWQLMDDEQNQANEDFTSHPNFEKFRNLIALNAILGLKDEGIQLIKANIELEKDPTNVSTTKDLLGNFEAKLQKYNLYWAHLKSISECYNTMSQIYDLYQQKRYGDTLELALKAATLSKEVFGADHLNTAVANQYLAIITKYLGKENESTAFFKEANTALAGIIQKNPQSVWETPSFRLWCDQDFTPAGLNLGMKENEVWKLLGKPAAMNRGTIPWGESPEVPFKDLFYKGITVRLVQTDKNEEFRVQQRFLIKSPRYPTLRGIKVGDAYQKVLFAYGEPAVQNQQELEYQVMYFTGQGNSWKHLTFKLNPKGMVETIIVGPVQE
jgi:hypothetical protein